MDYISSINEGDDAVGASPWENSPAASPRNNRTSFSALGTEPAPFGFNSQPSNGLNPDPAAAEGFQRPGTATTASVTDGDTDASTTLDPQSQSFEASQPGSSQEQSLPDPEEAAPAPAAAQGEQPKTQEQQRRPAQPQFRLQAKITGLERTGKKDPILRFDVHVCRTHGDRCLYSWS